MMAKRKARKKKAEGIEAIAEEIGASRQVKAIARREEELAEKFGETASKVNRALDSSEDVQKLKKEIKERPLASVAVAFAAGVMVAMLLGGRR